MPLWWVLVHFFPEKTTEYMYLQGFVELIEINAADEFVGMYH